MRVILGIHSGALGDVILFARFLRGLAAARGGGIVRLVCGGEKAKLLRGLGAIDEGLDFDALPMAEVFTDRPLAECELPRRLGREDILASCFVTGEAARQARLTAMCGAGEAIFLPVRPPASATGVPWPGHLVDYWASLAGIATVPVDAWRVPDDYTQSGRAELAALGVAPEARYVVIHPGSGAPDKCWPLERFIALGQLVAQAGRRAVFVLGPVEMERWPEGAMGEIRRQFATLACPSLGQLAGVLALAEGFVGNDSGPAHLAAAVGAKTIALFGATDPVHFAPLGPAVRVVKAPTIADILLAAVARRVIVA